jgi:integrase
MATLRQRGDRWQAIVRKVGHPPVVQTFSTRAAARTWSTRTEADIDAGRKVSTVKTARVADVLRAYRGLVTMTKAMSRSKAHALESIEAALGRHRVADIDVAMLRGYAERRRAQGAGSATIGQDLSYIGTALRHGAPLLGVEATPAIEALRTARALLTHAGAVARSRERTRRPTDQELLLLRARWIAHPAREIPMWRLVLFAIATAMRLGEILTLERRGFSPETRTMVIRDRKHPRAKQGNTQVVPLLAGHVAVGGEPVDPIDLIAQQLTGPTLIFPYRPASVSTAFTRAVQACGIPDLHFHDLRHDGVSRLFEARYPLEHVALLSGHRDWNQLRRYTQIRAEHVHGRP